MSKASHQITTEEEMMMKDCTLVAVEGQKGFIDVIVSRMKLKQSYEYEASFEARRRTTGCRVIT